MAGHKMLPRKKERKKEKEREKEKGRDEKRHGVLLLGLVVAALAQRESANQSHCSHSDE